MSIHAACGHRPLSARPSIGGQDQGGAVHQRPRGDHGDLVAGGLAIAAATLHLQDRLGHGVHAVQVALGQQAAARVGGQRPSSRMAPERTKAPDSPRPHRPRPSRPTSTVLVKQS